MEANQKDMTIEVPIVDDNQWNPDSDFTIQLFAPNSDYTQLEGDDTQCTVTIIDEDSPGVIGFESTDVQISAIDKTATIKLVRTEGADGNISCRIQTANGLTDTAKEGEHFEALDTRVEF